jgi:hypothetical protein
MKNIFFAVMLLLTTIAFVPPTPKAMLPKQQIRNALKTPFDLLAQMPVVYHLKQKNPDRYKEQENYQITDYNLKGLIVDKRKNTDSNETLQGSRTDNEGYLLLNYDYLEKAGLIDTNGNFKGNPNTDTFSYQSKTYKIIDLEMIGQLVDTFTAVKIYFKT